MAIMHFYRLSQYSQKGSYLRTALQGNNMKMMTTITLFMMTWCTQAASLKDFKPFSYDVLFTNPECKTYSYDNPQINANGEEVKSKTKNAYCKSSDSSRSQNRTNSPHTRFIDWISDTKTKSIFMAYLSFSKHSVAEELCSAVKRGVRLTMIIDSNNDGDVNRMRELDFISKCAHNPSQVRLELRGGEGRGSNKLGYAHNKVFLVNYDSKAETKVAFSSGNLSSGLATHHENWHFVTTHASSFFAQAHLCLMEGMLEHHAGKKEYAQFIKSCKSQIKSQEEDDIKTFFVPGEGPQALATIKKSFGEADLIQVAAHRFSLNTLEQLIQQSLVQKKTVQLVADDDLHYSAVYKKGIGRNMTNEAYKVRNLVSRGMQAHFIETWMDNLEAPESLQLHHNKFLIFSKRGNAFGVFSGAGNLTNAAFATNFENFYYTTIDTVVDEFSNQYQYLFSKLGKSAKELPEELVLP